MLEIHYKIMKNKGEDGDAMNKTKDLLVSSLQELLLTKPLDKIRISDITDHCGMNRQTFYYHFHDIYDLIEYAYYHDSSRPYIIDKLAVSAPFSWRHAFDELLNYIHDNEIFILRIRHSLSSNYLTNILKHSVEEYLHKVLHIANEEYHVSEKNMNNIQIFYNNAIVGRILEWIDHDMKEEIEELSSALTTLMEGTLENTLLCFSKQEN